MSNQHAFENQLCLLRGDLQQLIQSLQFTIHPEVKGSKDLNVITGVKYLATCYANSLLPLLLFLILEEKGEERHRVPRVGRDQEPWDEGWGE